MKLKFIVSDDGFLETQDIDLYFTINSMQEPFYSPDKARTRILSLSV